MRRLRQRYHDDPRTTALCEAAAGGRSGLMGAVHGGLAPMLIAACHERLGAAAPRIAVGPDAVALATDLADLGCRTVVLPELDEHDHDDEAAWTENDRHILARRVAAVETALAGALLVATPRAVDQGVPDLAALGARSIVLRPGDEADLQRVAEDLIDHGYAMTAAVDHPGQLAVRGGILDVFPLAAELPLRIEFFGDEVDTIRRFDPDTQESIARSDDAILATGSAVVPDSSLWAQFDRRPLWVLGDVALADRLQRAHGREELRLARRLEHGALDGASLGIERFVGDRHHDLRELAAAATDEDSSVVVLARNREAELELAGALAEHEIAAEVRIGRLSAGWRDQEAGLLVVHDFELAHRQPTRRRTTKIAGGAPLDSLSDLKPGSYVVHVSQGIARFKGMATLERRGYLEDFLLLEFADEAKLYVPTTGIDLIQKYVGGSGRHPELSKLGGNAWRRKKARAEKAVEDLTAELLATQAQRAAARGIAHDADDAAIRRFEAAFPYEETEDQLAAAREIKADLEKPVPMDRLLCGDVGFGKTEIAMRAAFKVVRSRYQVAVLAPTTLLSEQHRTTFEERFAESGITVACINRFRSASERRDLVEQLKLGEIDIVIGTHALLAEDLRFAALGLLIVDEEHRFGVKHKERLKQVSAGIDVLTLSATPIPRTLHFSLLGLRNISVLAEAPADRLAVETRVAPWDDALIRSALQRELEREGQVFVVHNRVRDIDRIARKLERLVGELRLEVVHGQMDEQRIARAMADFRNHRIDCLVATSIIESGIDIPNANTLIVNNAYAFGLAELHQIRGRIGRFTRQAYAYFLTPSERDLSPEAIRRLDAIQEYAELGAGFKLAMRDLEIRGAGNLLGSQQSGHIDAVGYDLYCKLLAEAVQRSGLATEETASGSGGVSRARSAADSVIAFAIDAYVPDTYLDSPTLKFELHQHLDRCRSVGDVDGLARATRDRYGPLPPEVARLFRLRAIRSAAGDYGITRIELVERHLRLFVADELPDELARVELPELIHVQADGEAVVLFLRSALDPDQALDLLTRLFDARITVDERPQAQPG